MSVVTPPTDFLIKYFVPPDTTQYMKWGQVGLVVFFFGIMFAAISYAYIYVNYYTYQDRISVITNAYLFGKNPQQQFEQYIKNAQAETISSALNDIQSAGNNLSTANERLNSNASRLARKIDTDVQDKYAESNSLGISIQKNIAKLRDTISKLGGAFVLNNYMTDGAIMTTQEVKAQGT
jgi:hypothetical protein